MSRVLRNLALAIAVLAVAATSTSAVAANPTEGVIFKPVAKSGVAGKAELGANGVGTRVSVRIIGLTPGATARVLLRTGRWPALSASFATAVGTVKADSRGVARASSSVRFRNEPVSWRIVADGDHVLTVVVGSRIVAYAAIPGMD